MKDSTAERACRNNLQRKPAETACRDSLEKQTEEKVSRDSLQRHPSKTYNLKIPKEYKIFQNIQKNPKIPKNSNRFLKDP